MTRTTISLNDPLFKKLQQLGEQENRSLPNLIETLLMRCVENEMYATDFEMESIHKDEGLKKSILKGLSDYKTGRGRLA